MFQDRKRPEAARPQVASAAGASNEAPAALAPPPLPPPPPAVRQLPRTRAPSGSEQHPPTQAASDGADDEWGDFS